MDTCMIRTVDGSTTYVAATKKVFKYNHVIWYARFDNGVQTVAKRGSVDYTVDLGIELDAVDEDIEGVDLAGVDLAGTVSAETKITDADPELMFALEFSSEFLNKRTQLKMVPKPLGDGGLDVEYKTAMCVLEDVNKPFEDAVMQVVDCSFKA